MGIRLKLFIPVLLSLCMFAIILHFFWFKDYVDKERKQFVVHQQEVLLALMPGLTAPILASDFASVFKTLDRQMEQKKGDWQSMKLVDGTGKRIYPINNIATPDINRNANLFLIEFPIEYENTIIAIIHLTIDWTEKLKQVSTNKIKLEIIAFSFLLMINIASVTWQSNWIRRPVLALEKAAESLEKGNYSEQLPKASNDEFGRLTNAFQSMRDELEISKNELEEKVSERTRQLENAKKKAEEANDAKSDFLSSMSHELRTPLNAILGFGQLLGNANSEIKEEHLDWVREILEAGYHLLELINQVLDLSKIESGHLSLTITSINAEEIVDSAIQMVTSIAEKNQIIIHHETNNDNIHTLADTIRIRQILINLLSNAIKYNKLNGRVTIKTMITKNNYVRFMVEDTGYGIANNKLSKLFDPFERLGADMSKIEGSGIGLSVSKNLVEAMKGEIGVESTEGSGSVFWFDMPIAHQQPIAKINPENSEENSSAIQSNKQKTHILYIEDNVSNQKLVEKIFSKLNDYDLTIASNGLDGLKLAEKNRPGLILLDINLPDINGDIVFSRLKENAATKNISVIAMSANAMEHDIQKGVEIGFDAYLTKPINIEKLLNTVQSHC